MNTTNLTALIGAITALVVAVSGVITLIVHIKNHQAITADKPANSGVKPSLINPSPPDWPH